MSDTRPPTDFTSPGFARRDLSEPDIDPRPAGMHPPVGDADIERLTVKIGLASTGVLDFPDEIAGRMRLCMLIEATCRLSFHND